MGKRASIPDPKSKDSLEAAASKLSLLFTLITRYTEKCVKCTALLFIFVYSTVLISLACPKIGASGCHLKTLVGIAFYTFYDLEACGLQLLLDPCAPIENKIERNLFVP